MFSMIVCLVVFCGIAVRRVGRFELPMWLVMTSGAVLVLVTRNISLTVAWHSISWPVIFYLFGAFVVAQALEQSQIFSSKLRAYLQKRHRALWLFIAMVIFSAVLSALLMNDAVALLFAPLLLQIAKDLDQPSEPWLLALCFAVTIGSVCSPVGNPQNLLIAMHLSGPPFVIFLHYLFIPTLVNILILIGLFYFVYKKLWQHRPDALPLNIKVDKQLGRLATVALAAFVFLILYKIVVVSFPGLWQPSLAAIAVLAALPIILLSKQRIKVLRSIDWHTLIFFIAMFILMQAVWNGGVLQHMMAHYDLNLHKNSVILMVSVVLSQLISNVPLVALYLPVLQHLQLEVQQFMALAAGSTLAGNFWVLGAASNVIVLQAALKNKDAGFRVSRFLLLGIPLGLLNVLVVWIFLA